MRIEKVRADRVYPLRLEVLRPGGALTDCIFEGDDDPRTVHFAALDKEGVIRGIVSFYRAFHPAVAGRCPVQLRGMATHPSVRGKGFGKALVHHALDFFSARSDSRESAFPDTSRNSPVQACDVIWCNARVGADSFYARSGFRTIGKPFEVKGIGMHQVMYVRL